MRVLLTGAAGFIGSHALKYFSEKHPEWEWVIIDRLNYAAHLERYRWALNLPFPKAAGVKIVLHDLRAAFPDQVKKEIGEVDYVVHFAAETHVDRSMVDPKPFLDSNIIATYNLLEYCRFEQPKLKMFFGISTDEVYGPAPLGTDHTEDAPHRPSNPYSATKAASEDLVYAWNHSMGVPTIVSNTMNNVGEYQHSEKYVPKIIRGLFKQEVITVHGTPDEPGSRKYLYASDHADAIDFLMTHGRRGEKYNVVGQEEVSNLELVRRLEKITGLEARIKFVDFHSTRPGHDKRYSLDGSKLAKMGWQPKVTVDEALGRIVSWSLEHPEWL
jgi:dTDP-glucose 4,6-dehydratase